jgi:hypothetical protein
MKSLLNPYLICASSLNSLPIDLLIVNHPLYPHPSNPRHLNPPDHFNTPNPLNLLHLCLLQQLGWQMVCAVAIIAWSSLTLTPAFLLLKAIGKMRVPREVEIRGLDIYKHGEAAYPLTAYGHGWDEAALKPSAREALRNVSEHVDGEF